VKTWYINVSHARCMDA